MPKKCDLSDKELIEALADVEEGLSAKAVDFVDEQAKRVARSAVGFKLSVAQRKWAEDLWREHG